MNITVKLYASFRVGRFDSEQRTCSATTTIREIITEIGIPAQDLGIVLRNGIHAPLDSTVAEGDSISLLPRISGG